MKFYLDIAMRNSYDIIFNDVLLKDFGDTYFMHNPNSDLNDEVLIDMFRYFKSKKEWDKVVKITTLRAKINAKPYSWLEIGNSTNIFSKGYNHPATNSRKLAGTNRTENEEDWRKYTFHASPLFLPTNPDGSLIINAAYTPTRSIADGAFADLIYGKSNGEQNDFTYWS